MDENENEEKKNEPGRKKKLPNIEITELFMAKCGKKGFDRCFYGTINREKDENGKEVAVSSAIYMKDERYIWARAEDQWKLGELLDAIVEWRLVYGLHKDMGKFTRIAEKRFFHN
jgi:hypothetical protein